MRVLIFLLEKEFKQIFRNKAMLPIIFVMPIVQLLLLSFAIDYEVKNLDLFVVDHDLSTESRELVSRFTSSNYFEIIDANADPEEAQKSMHAWQADVILEIPHDFSQDLYREGEGQLLLKVDAIDGAKAGLAASYSQKIIQTYLVEFTGKNAIRFNKPVQFMYKGEVVPVLLYNPEMDYKQYMVPGILVVLITMIGAFLTSMNIVREKELGNIEQINVTPIKKYPFILGKTIPFWIIALIELSVGLLAAYFVFGISSEGSLFIIYGFAAIYMFLILGFGLFVSTITQTQQQAMFISWFFLVIFLLMGGLFTPIENMPPWAQKITYINPIRFFIEVTRSVMLKGATFMDVINQFILITVYAVIMVLAALRGYRKRV